MSYIRGEIVFYFKYLKEMNYDQLALLAKAEDVTIIAKAACMEQFEMKVIKLYRKHVLIMQLWDRDRENDELREYGREVYFKLLGAARDLMDKCQKINYHGLAVFDLQLFNDYN